MNGSGTGSPDKTVPILDHALNIQKSTYSLDDQRRCWKVTKHAWHAVACIGDERMKVKPAPDDPGICRALTFGKVIRLLVRQLRCATFPSVSSYQSLRHVQKLEGLDALHGDGCLGTYKTWRSSDDPAIRGSSTQE